MAASDLKDKRDGHLAIRDWKNGKRQRRGTSDPGVWCSLSGESTLQCAVLSDDPPHHPGLVDNTRHPNRRERRRLSRHIYVIYLLALTLHHCRTMHLFWWHSAAISCCGTACETTAITQLFTRSFRTGANIPGIVFRKGASEATLTITISMLPTRTHDRCGETTACFENYVERVRLKFHAHCKCQSRCQLKAYPSRTGVKFQGLI